MLAENISVNVALADVVIFGESCAETCGIEYRSRTDYAVFGQVRKFVECISKDIHGVAYDYVCCVRSVFCYLGDNALCYVDVCLRKLKARLSRLSCNARCENDNVRACRVEIAAGINRAGTAERGALSDVESLSESLLAVYVYHYYFRRHSEYCKGVCDCGAYASCADD